MARKRKLQEPRPRIPLPRKPPKVERDTRKESDRRRCRRPVVRETEGN